MLCFQIHGDGAALHGSAEPLLRYMSPAVWCRTWGNWRTGLVWSREIPKWKFIANGAVAGTGVDRREYVWYRQASGKHRAPKILCRVHDAPASRFLNSVKVHAFLKVSSFGYGGFQPNHATRLDKPDRWPQQLTPQNEWKFIAALCHLYSNGWAQNMRVELL